MTTNITDPPLSPKRHTPTPYSTKYGGAVRQLQLDSIHTHTAFNLDGTDTAAAAAAAVAAAAADNVEVNQAKRNPQYMSYKDWITKMHENVFKNAKKVIKVTPELRKEIEIRMSALIMEKNIVVTEEGESNVLIIDT